MTGPRIVVVGAGVVGLTSALALRQRDFEVTVFDPHPGSGASSVAAGMLAPVTEAAYGEEELSVLACRAAERWTTFAEELEELSGLSVGYRRCGTLLVAAEAADAADLEAILAYHQDLGLASSWLTPREARRLEPLLSPAIRGAIFAADDSQVDNRRFLSALAVAVRRLGVRVVEEQVLAVTSDNRGVTGVRTSAAHHEADLVVLAAGFATGLLPGLDDALQPPVRPVKGQILRLRVPPTAPAPEMTVRAVVSSSAVYVVPREDGQVVVGATVEERGADHSLTAGGVYMLLRDAIRVLPAMSEYEITESSVGLRPGSFDNAAIIGPAGPDGLVLACGHYRNGILFSPITGDAVVSIVEEGTLPDWAAAFSPARLTATGVST